MSTAATTIETPSGKGAGDENFPVGSFLIGRRERPHVAVYYAFARAIDDIADNPALSPADKIARLEAMDRALIDPLANDDPGLAKAVAVATSFAARGIDIAHARDLISAFKQDAVKSRYASWDELMDYCDRSAAPVGRFLLELHGEDRGLFAASDALCNALQVINHLQDCGDDLRRLDRVYVPLDWLGEVGETVASLAAGKSSAGVRQVIDRCLVGVTGLLDQARTLPGRMKNRRLARETAVIVALAERLAEELCRRDPLAERVALGKGQMALTALKGVVRAWRA